MMGMRRPIFVRVLSDEERETLVAGLRSSDAFVLRRCQIVLASARGKIAREIAADLGCDGQTVRTAIAAFNATGRACLVHWSSCPQTTHPAFTAEKAEQLKTLLHQSPRALGKPTSVWTLPLAAEVSFEQGLTKERVSGETVRATLARLDIRWKRVKEWITSPDPAYARKKGRATV
jgi:transposase